MPPLPLLTAAFSPSPPAVTPFPAENNLKDTDYTTHGTENAQTHAHTTRTHAHTQKHTSTYTHAQTQHAHTYTHTNTLARFGKHET